MDFNFYKLNLNMLFEIILRLVLWWLFIYFDRADPFIREIKSEELWLYQYPVTHSIVPARLLWLTICFYPAIFLIIEYYITGRKEEPVAAVLALTLAYGFNGFITCILKVMVGRPRPDFFYRCYPDGKGTDLTKCAGARKSWTDGRKSFPSGHASFSFACMVFMSLYLARKLHLFEKSRRGQSWQLIACTLPVLIATGISISRTCDYHHHYQDVICGAVLGTVISYLCYKLYFPMGTEVTEAVQNK